MQLSDALVAVLADWNLGHVFGVGGANIEPIHDAIHRLGGRRLTSVLARREDGAAFMADARARVHRTLGVCCCTSGGAMFNLTAGIAESFAESVPVLAIVGQPPRSLEGRGAFQDSSGIGRSVDAVQLFSCMTKWTERVDPTRFWDQLRHAVSTAVSGRPGPVVLLCPRDTYAVEVGERPADWPATVDDLVVRPPIDPLAVEELFEAIRMANRPTILIGQGVRRSRDGENVVAFAREAAIAVATTMSARAEFPNDDPLYLGVVGVAGHPSAHDYLRNKADLVVVAGAGFNVMTRQPVDTLREKALFAVNVDCGEIARGVGPLRTVTGDVGEVFGAMRSLLRQRPFTATALNGYRLHRYLPRLAEVVPRPASARGERDELLQSEAIAEISEMAPMGGHVVLDAGNCASAVLHHSTVPAGTSSTIALGAGGMGYGVAAAIGAQLGSEKGARTIAFCGDGGMLCNATEIHVAVDLGLPILFVVFNNQMHGMCAIRQQLFFEGRVEAATYAPIDFAKLARGFGTEDGLWVGSAGCLAELHPMVEEYFRSFASKPGLLELRLPREEMPPFTPFLPKGEPTYVAGADGTSAAFGPHDDAPDSLMKTVG